MRRFIRLKHILSVALAALVLCGLYLWVDDEFLSSMLRAGLLQVDEGALQKFSHLLSELNLDTTQNAEVRAILWNAKGQLKKYVEQSAANAKSLEELADDDYEANKIDDLANKRGVIVSKAIQLRIATVQKVYQILTPEQQTKFLAGLFPPRITQTEMAEEKVPQAFVKANTLVDPASAPKPTSKDSPTSTQGTSKP